MLCAICHAFGDLMALLPAIQFEHLLCRKGHVWITESRISQLEKLQPASGQRARTVQQAHGADVGHVVVVAPLVEQAADLVHPALAVVALHPALLRLLVVLRFFSSSDCAYGAQTSEWGSRQDRHCTQPSGSVESFFSNVSNCMPNEAQGSGTLAASTSALSVNS